MAGLQDHADRPSHVAFLGLDFDASTLKEAAREILSAEPAPFAYVVTPNVHHLVKIGEDRETLLPAYRNASRVYCDSRILSLLARLFSIRLPVVTGSDLTVVVLAEAEKRGMHIAVVGPEEKQIDTLRTAYPNLRISQQTPPMGFISSPVEVERCIAFVEAEKAPITFLALGMPQQELLASKISARGIATGVGLCIGASIDFVTGKQRRAPIWMQKAGLEWLHRLVAEPRRMAVRYLIECPRIAYLAWRWWRDDKPERAKGR